MGGKKKPTGVTKSSACKPLPKEIRSIVRSGVAITSVAQCVEELVLNSVDASATSVFVGINLDQFNVRVEDDGIGLSKQDLEVVGTRYTTSKCLSLEDLSTLRYYGYRGEALASIIDVSSAVELIGRTADGDPYRRSFINGKSKGVIEKQPDSKKKSKGLTVLICGLLSQLPVRQRRVDKSIQLEEIKITLQQIALINPLLSIEFRNEAISTLLFSYRPSVSQSEAFRQLYGEKRGLEINLIEEYHLYDKMLFNALIGKDLYRTKNFQFVYVNKRFIGCRGKIHRQLNQSLAKVLLNEKGEGLKKSLATENKYPVFVVNLKCPFDMYDITLEPKKSQVEFRNWESCLKGIDTLILRFQSTLETSHKAQQIMHKSVSIVKNRHHMSSLSKEHQTHTLSEELEDIGQTVTTHDVKSAIHSRFVVRDRDDKSSAISSVKSTPYGCRGNTAISSGLEDEFSQVHSGSTDQDSSPELRIKQKSSMKRSPHYKLIDNNSRQRSTSRKTTTYDLRRTKVSDANIIAHPLQKNKRLVSVVPRRSRVRVNADIFQKFPEWSKTGGSPSASAEEVPPLKRARQLAYVPKESIPRKLLVDSKKMISLGEKKVNSNEVDIDHESYGWKIKRFMAECSKKKNTSEKSETSSSDIEISPRRLKKVPQAMDLQLDDTNISFEENSSSKDERVSVTGSPDETDWHWVIDISVESADGFVKKRNLKRRAYAIRQEVTTDLESSKHGRLLLNKIAGTNREEEVIVLPEKPGNNKFGLLRPSTFGNNFGAPLMSFTDITLTSASKTFENLKSKNVNLLSTSPEWVTSEVPLPKEKTPDPYGLKTIIRSQLGEEIEEGGWSDWEVDIVSDAQGQDWLQTTEDGKIIYMNLSTGDMSYDMLNIVTRTKIPVTQAAQRNFRVNWLRRYFPKGCNKFWKREKNEVKIQLNGDPSAVTSHLGKNVKDCIIKGNIEDLHSDEWKWRNGFNGKLTNENDPEGKGARFLEPWNTSVGVAEIPVLNLNAPEVKFWNKAMSSSYRFTKQDLSRVKVLMQWDRKFIVAKIDTSLSTTGEKDAQVLVLFDQHAVHERIRLEQLVEDLFVLDVPSGQKRIDTFSIAPPMSLTFSDTEVRIMHSYKEAFNRFGVDIQTVSSNTVKVSSVPKCFAEKVHSEVTSNRENLMRNLISTLLQEQVHQILKTKGNFLQPIPKTIFNILCSQACHGAIKFGDELDFKVCETMISNLKNCKTPFQCAHGRPALVPLIDLSSLFNDKLTHDCTKIFGLIQKNGTNSSTQEEVFNRIDTESSYFRIDTESSYFRIDTESPYFN